MVSCWDATGSSSIDLALSVQLSEQVVAKRCQGVLAFDADRGETIIVTVPASATAIVNDGRQLESETLPKGCDSMEEDTVTFYGCTCDFLLSRSSFISFTRLDKQRIRARKTSFQRIFLR
jgi:hypothetical protein